jgi:hypothetical protein
MQTMLSCLNLYRGVLGPAIDKAQVQIDKGYRLMVAAMREKDPGKMWYPNANSTDAPHLRGGQRLQARPMPCSTTSPPPKTGILQKEDNTNEEFVVPASGSMSCW